MANEPIKVLVVDDEPTMLSLMQSILEGQEGYSVDAAADGEEALSKVRSNPPDLLVTDLKMPRLSGERLTVEALRIQPDLTVVVSTGNGTLQGAVELMKAGVFDYLTKPFQVNAFLASVGRAAEKIRWAPLSKDSQAIIGSLMTALETKDPYLKNHSSRVAAFSRQLSLDLGLKPRDAFLIERAALVHDLGKIGVPESVLHKNGPLTPDEFAQIRRHPVYSAEIIRPLKEFKECIREVYHHHERLDGTGYPDGLRGEEIPLGAKVISVCDSYDAMASDRPYRPRMSTAKICKNLLDARGTQLEGDLVDTFLRRVDEA